MSASQSTKVRRFAVGAQVAVVTAAVLTVGVGIGVWLDHPAASAAAPAASVAVGGGRGGIDPGDDYPAQWKNAPMDSMLDQWREYNRECTSWVAWALHSRNGFDVPFYDNANNWGTIAAARHYAVDKTPADGSVAWSNAGQYGHVAYVVSANSDGTVTIEDYNEYYTGTFDRRTVAASHFTGFIHFADLTHPAPTPPAPAPVATLTVAPPNANPGGVTVNPQPATGGLQGGGNPGPGTSNPQNPPAKAIQGGNGGSGGGSSHPTPTPAPHPTPTPKPSPTPTPTPPPAPTWTEQSGTHGSPAFQNPYNASGQGPTVPAMSYITVLCRVYAPQIVSANPDGWWYRLGGVYGGNFYAVANTFWNGDVVNQLPYTHNTDFSVAVC